MVGGIYGATLGVTMGAVPAATEVIEIAVAVFALLCGIPGARLGSLIEVLSRVRFGRYYFGLAAATVGAIAGGFLATMLVMAFGAILGAVVGGVLARAVVGSRRGFLTRLVGGLAGVMLGTFIGVVWWAIRLNQAAALVGLAWGTGIGIVVGPLLLSLFVAMLSSLPPVHRDGGNFVDATFRED